MSYKKNPLEQLEDQEEQKNLTQPLVDEYKKLEKQYEKEINKINDLKDNKIIQLQSQLTTVKAERDEAVKIIDSKVELLAELSIDIFEKHLHGAENLEEALSQLRYKNYVREYIIKSFKNFLASLDKEK